MKIGIVTIIDYENYGNRLQNYALDRLLRQEGFQTKSGLVFFSRKEWVHHSSSFLIKAIKKCIPFFLYRIYHRRASGRIVEPLRVKKFKEFTEEYIDTFPYLYVKNDKDLRKKIGEPEFDYFIVGSDQVWNPDYEGKDYEFLLFTDKKKRLSFAASMGVESIPENCKIRYKNMLNSMKYISVREERAVDIVRELTGRQADLVSDPTLLLEKREWNDIVRKPRVDMKKEYILAYFLGEIPDAVQKFAENKQLYVYYINSRKDADIYSINPAEFLYMLKYAKYVLTDSFHAVAFSVKFEKEFYVFRRVQSGVSDMFSRIETILRRFELQSRGQGRKTIFEQAPVSREHWKRIEDKLMAEKAMAMDQLKKNMTNVVME